MGQRLSWRENPSAVVELNRTEKSTWAAIMAGKKSSPNTGWRCDKCNEKHPKTHYYCYTCGQTKDVILAASNKKKQEERKKANKQGGAVDDQAVRPTASPAPKAGAAKPSNYSSPAGQNTATSNSNAAEAEVGPQMAALQIQDGDAAKVAEHGQFLCGRSTS